MELAPWRLIDHLWYPLGRHIPSGGSREQGTGPPPPPPPPLFLDQTEVRRAEKNFGDRVWQYVECNRILKVFTVLLRQSLVRFYGSIIFRM